MKILGLSLLSVLIIATGNFFAREKLRRIKMLDKLSLMIKSINSQIVYSHLSVPDLLEYIGKSEEFNELGFTTQVRHLLKEGYDYGEAWKKTIENDISFKSLKKEDINMLICFVNGLGSTDVEGQMSNCETYSGLFKQKADTLRKNAEASAKIYNCLGMLTAALVFIILY